jgi:hypothetical protein
LRQFLRFFQTDYAFPAAKTDDMAANKAKDKKKAEKALKQQQEQEATVKAVATEYIRQCKAAGIEKDDSFLKLVSPFRVALSYASYRLNPLLGTRCRRRCARTPAASPPRFFSRPRLQALPDTAYLSD